MSCSASLDATQIDASGSVRLRESASRNFKVPVVGARGSRVLDVTPALGLHEKTHHIIGDVQFTGCYQRCHFIESGIVADPKAPDVVDEYDAAR